MHRTTRRFRRALASLPPDIRVVAARSFDLLKNDPRHPSLHFKRVGCFWSVRIGLHYRALATEAGADHLWLWIGNHAEYDRLLSSPRSLGY